MFLALFHTKAGKFTIEEFNVATEEFKKHASPKVYTYCKNLQEGEQESPELADFKQKLFEEMGHYWSRYNNRDSMQLHFVMQLQLVETSGMVEKMKLEDGTVMLEGMPIAKIDNLQFAAGNAAYQKMSAELAALPEKIEKARQRVKKFPDDEDLIDDLQQKLNRYNKLKDEFSQIQKSLFETAQRIAAMQLEQVSDMLRRAIEAFEDGNLERANTLLDEIAHEAEHHMAQLEQQRTLVHQDIEVFMLQAKTVMADASIVINERIRLVIDIYVKADDWAQRSAFPQEKYINLLDDYTSFLCIFAFYDNALTISFRLLAIRESIYGFEHTNTAISYNNIGSIYYHQGQLSKALEFHLKALSVYERELGIEHPNTIKTYINIGAVYDCLGDYPKALDYYIKALMKQEKNFGFDNPDTATLYNNIGVAYGELGLYPMTFEYYLKALTIREKMLGLGHPLTAETYDNIGMTYNSLGNYSKALEFHFKALAIYESVFGQNHPDTAISYNNIGAVYNSSHDYPKALNYYFKALYIKEKIMGMNNTSTAISYYNIGGIYSKQSDYPKALDFYLKALEIFENHLGPEHPNTHAVKMSIKRIKAMTN
jgi:tetratricopeptide (TPR) repeat protein